MDNRRDLVEGLQRAFTQDDSTRNTKEASDVEYKENTNSLYIKKQNTYDMLNNKEPKDLREMSEEEVFERLLKERR